VPDSGGLEYAEVRKHPESRHVGKSILGEAKQILNSAEDKAQRFEKSIVEKAQKIMGTKSPKALFQLGDRAQFKYEEQWKDGVVTSTNPLLVRYDTVPDSEGLEYAEVRKQPESRHVKKSILEEAKQIMSSANDKAQHFENSIVEEAQKIMRTKSPKALLKLGDRVLFNYEEQWKDGVVTSTNPLLVRYETVPDSEGLEYAEVRKQPESRHVKTSILEEAKQIMSSAKDKAQHVEKSIFSEAQQIMSTAGKAIGVDHSRNVDHAKNGKTSESMTDADPSEIINRASNIMSIGDFKVTKPTSAGPTGLASPFNFP
jgi:vacuolar-type H+-ATPase subunit H